MKYSRISTLKFPGGPGMGLGKMRLMFRAGGPPRPDSSFHRGSREGGELGGGSLHNPWLRLWECPRVERVYRKWREVLT